ncbi:hypothetical protein K432DRAFT_376951 [Lepidopterella palustris CBS 459.81]|uniref:Uncharacterized protein n=1 Tax=Lepidopterella palustris CBS 459.81 TaxID=1314670 RepID=A0A8E2ELS4_9PEZI|nr:hypothetical protein K432DRAFT_376951 [Lepidopterella palustris CBS 459.81]
MSLNFAPGRRTGSPWLRERPRSFFKPSRYLRFWPTGIHYGTTVASEEKAFFQGSFSTIALAKLPTFVLELCDSAGTFGTTSCPFLIPPYSRSTEATTSVIFLERFDSRAKGARLELLPFRPSHRTHTKDKEVLCSLLLGTHNLTRDLSSGLPTLLLPSPTFAVPRFSGWSRVYF